MLSKHDAIDTAMVRHLVAAQAIRGASIVGVPGGWSVLLKLGLHEHVLCAQRGERAPRTWRTLDGCVAYLRAELRLARYELDASNHSE